MIDARSPDERNTRQAIPVVLFLFPTTDVRRNMPNRKSRRKILSRAKYQIQMHIIVIEFVIGGAHNAFMTFNASDKWHVS